MRTKRWLALGLAATSLALVLLLGIRLLEDWRIRLRTLVKLDPPAAPTILRLDGGAFTVTGALVRRTAPDRAVLRAWAPTPTIAALDPAPTGTATVEVENLPLRVRLSASGPVEETRAGPTRTLRWSPRLTRYIGFAAPTDHVTFTVLGDTGDSHIFAEALRLSAAGGADFLLHVGDLIYEDVQMPNIEKILAASPVPIFIARGNHDYRNAARIDFMRRLAPSYYSFRMGGATFVVLDNAGDYLPGLWRWSTQYRWWTEALGQPREGPFFVAMHKPPFDRRPGPRYAAMLDGAFARQLMRDFDGARVVAVFTGHVHATHLWVEDGIPYVVSGEGYTSPDGPDRSRMAWVRVRGWDVAIEQTRIFAD
ncbi:MAG: metallophosphoesterase [Candidatus Rokubacteria bacterium]|nr:metallophosphoesterase [Candidatus Rokubacteria bacterium]